MNRLKKLLDSMRAEIESISVHEDIGEIIDAFEQLDGIVHDYIIDHEDDEE